MTTSTHDFNDLVQLLDSLTDYGIDQTCSCEEFITAVALWPTLPRSGIYARWLRRLADEVYDQPNHKPQDWQNEYDH